MVLTVDGSIISVEDFHIAFQESFGLEIISHVFQIVKMTLLVDEDVPAPRYEHCIVAPFADIKELHEGGSVFSPALAATTA